MPPGQGWTHDPYGAAIVDDAKHGPTMYGRGVAVSKSDFATYTFALLALQALSRSGHSLNGCVELHFTYDEEVGGDIGPRLLLEEGLTRAGFRDIRRLFLCGHHGAQRMSAPRSHGARPSGARGDARVWRRCARRSNEDPAGAV